MKKKRKPVFADLHSLTEDQRIDLVGRCVMMGQTTGFLVEDDEKADRYIKKLTERFPGVQIGARGKVGTSVAVKVLPPALTREQRN